MKKSYCVIHGHFYQPPRENAWTETLELQPSAAPFHDWNAKITHECYRPNAMARIVDPKGRVLEMVNNFHLISFDVGPTLMSWLERHSSRTYHHILQADRASVREHEGHGNAIAQVYNHMIMPLASERDRITQVQWGISDFKFRFGREPEGMWLPETAVNDGVLRVLIREKIKFTILAPHQAQKIRRIGSTDWEDVSKGTIDPTRPYRWFLEGDPAEFIDLFFYDGAISHDVSFGDLAWDARRLVTRLVAARNPGRQHPELIHIATDGETYGHHRAYGDRVLAYAAKYEAPARGLIVTNYGAYLEKFPPQFEVRLNTGTKEEGTSWSCPHGVGRWKEDCSCHTGGQAGWNQGWRKPLRQSFDFIRDRVDTLYERGAGGIFRDPWLARDHAIDLILDRSESARKKFLGGHVAHPLTAEETMYAMKLLEMERFSMLMYTSCGWFFAELSGIETVQVVQYAARAVELAGELGERTLEKEWLDRLVLAKSNLVEFADGGGVYEKLIRPSRMTPERLIHHHVLASLFSSRKEKPETLEASDPVTFAYKVKEKNKIELSRGTLKLRLGLVSYERRAIPEPEFYLYALLRARSYEFLTGVRPLANLGEFEKVKRKLGHALRKGNEISLIREIDEVFKPRTFTLKDLMVDERRKISKQLSGQILKRFYEVYRKLYEENEEALELFKEAHLPLPEEYRLAAEFVLNHRLTEAVRRIDWDAPRLDTKEVLAIAAECERWGLELKSPAAGEYLSKVLDQKIEGLSVKHGVKELGAIDQILKLGSRLGLRLHDRIAQDVFFVFLQEHLPRALSSYRIRQDTSLLAEIRAMLHLGRSLGFNMDRFRRKITDPIKAPTI